MQGKTSKMQQVSKTSLQYSEHLGKQKLQLFEVDESFLTEIFSEENKGETVGHIKMALAYDDPKRRQACLSTHETTYKVKNSETSNLMMLTAMQGPESGHILYTTNNFIELTGTQRRDHQVVEMLRRRHVMFSEDFEGNEPASLTQITQ